MRQSSSERASEGFRAREDLSPPQPDGQTDTRRR
ncbi:MAG: hypothetical protein RL155_542 [Actinomycetota bacterium]